MSRHRSYRQIDPVTRIGLPLYSRATLNTVAVLGLLVGAALASVLWVVL